MSDSVWPHRQQPTSLLYPWDSPGKNAGVGCRCLLQCMHACYIALVMSDSVWPYGQQPTRLLCPWDSLGKNTGVGYHFLLLTHDWAWPKSTLMTHRVLNNNKYFLSKAADFGGSIVLKQEWTNTEFTWEKTFNSFRRYQTHLEDNWLTKKLYEDWKTGSLHTKPVPFPMVDCNCLIKLFKR